MGGTTLSGRATTSPSFRRAVEPSTASERSSFPPAMGVVVASAARPFRRRMATMDRRLAAVASTSSATVDPDIVHVHFVPGEARDYFYYRACRRLVVSTYGSDVVFEPERPAAG